MKKILTLFAFAALFVGCKDLYGPTPEEVEAVVGQELTITVNPSSIGDTGFTAEIVTAEKNVFCSYVLCKEDQPSEKSADAVLKCTVAAVKGGLKATTYDAEGKEIASAEKESANGTFNAEKVVLEFSKLEQNTTYQLYAVAASATGLPGEVVSKSVLTTDSRVPSQTAAGTFDTDSTVTVVFSQPVSYVAGSGVSLSVFAENTTQFQNAQSIVDAPLDDEDITVGEDGKTVEIFYHPDELPAGAYFTINYPEGAFISDTGVDCKGCSAAFTFDKKGNVIVVDAEGEAATIYNARHVDPVTFEMIAPEETELFDPLPTQFEFTQNDKISAIAVIDGKALVEYSYGDESKLISLNLAYGSGWAYSLDGDNAVKGITVTLPEHPQAPGVGISIKLPEGILADAFGNQSEETVWTAEFLQLDEIGTGLFSEPAFLQIVDEEATLFYNPSSDVYRIADCFVPGYNLEFTWDKATNKCEIIGMQKTGYTNGGADIYVEDAKTYFVDQYSWEVLEANDIKQPYYEDGMFVFPNVAYEVPATGQYTDPIFTITFNMGRDITVPQLEGIWSCTSVADFWGDTYGPFDVAIQQAVDEAGAPVENVYAIVNLAPRLATMGVTAVTFGTWDADNSQLVIAYDETSGISTGGTPIKYKGFDNTDPDAAEYYDDVYFSVSAIPAAMVNLNAYGMLAGNSPYEMYYGGAMQLKRTADLPEPEPVSNCVEKREVQLNTPAPKAGGIKARQYKEGSFLSRGMDAYIMSAPKRVLK